MKKTIITLAVALLATATTFAQGTWKNDKAHSQLKFTIVHMAISEVEGAFKDFDATITTTKADFSDAKFSLVAKVASINTDIEKRDAHLKSADFFDVEKFETLNFTSTGIAKAGVNKYKVTGNLTIHGVTKPTTLEVSYRGTIKGQGGKEVAGFKVTGEIKRSDFQLGSKFASAMLSDEVQILANGEFGKAN